MSVTTSARFNQLDFDPLLPAGATCRWVGGPLEEAVEKTLTLEGGTDQQLSAAIQGAAAVFVDRKTASSDARVRLKQAYPTLRTWATDAATVNTNWPNMTAAQKDAAMRTTIQRLGIFLDRFGDLLQALNADA